MNRFLVCLILILAPSSSLYSQYTFGRNKVQYDNFDWHILKTEHFDIYYYPEMQELAEIGSSYAEDAYARLTNTFDHAMNRRIPLIFYSNHLHFQQTNISPGLIPAGVGGFFEFIKGRVVIPANGSLYDFKHVINHEMVHVFMMSKVNRSLKDHRRQNYTGPPLWFVEGLAEYWSEGWDSQAEMFIRDATISGYLVPLQRIQQILGSFLMYKEGQAICRFIARRFGEEKLLELMKNIWMSPRFSEVMRLTLGVDYKRFDKLWFYDEMKQRYPILKDNDMPGMVTRRLTEKGLNTKPAYCMRGNRESIVFTSNRTGYSGIYEMPYKSNRHEKELDVLIKGERTNEFESFDLLKSKIDVNMQGELAFVAKSRGKDAIYRMDLDKKAITSRLQFDELVTIYSPAWDAQGEKLVFTGINFSGRSDLYTYSFVTKELRKLTNDFYDDRDPVWSPDGKIIVFSSDRTAHGGEGSYNLFALSPESGEINYLTFGSHKDLAPAWSKDGMSIAFSSDRDGAFNIWMMKMPEKQFAFAAKTEATALPETDQRVPAAFDGMGRLKKITNFVTGAFDPEWTKDDAILFTAFEGFGFQLRKMSKIGDLFSKAAEQDQDSIKADPQKWELPKIEGATSSSNIKYSKKFSIDIAQSQITQDPLYGSSGGAQMAMSDMLGNDQFYFLLYNTANSKDDFLESFNFSVTKVNLSNRVNKAYGLYHFAGTYFDRIRGFFYERRFGGFAAMSYPLSSFKRVEASINIRKSNLDDFGLNNSRRSVLASNFISFTKDNSIWGASGPMDGERYSLTIGNTYDFQEPNTNFQTVIADYRRYFRLSQRVSYATRLWTALHTGKGAEYNRFFMGGSWDLRLYPRWQIWGTRLFLVSQEMRFPFIDRFSLSFPFGGIGFSAIRGAIFLDAGNAWDNKLDNVLGSAGFGARMRLGGFLVFRYDVGRRFTISNLNSSSGAPVFNMPARVYHRFFFGWDF